MRSSIKKAKGMHGLRHLLLFPLCGLPLCGLYCGHKTTALIITPPSSARDYWQLASLVATTFDAPADPSSKSNEGDDSQQPSLKSKMDALQWSLFGKSLTEESTYKQYVSTARRMRGKKYCLLVAKECIVDDDDNQMRVKDDVVGMVEMGMSPCPVTLQDTGDCFVSENDDSDASDTKDNSMVLRPQPTVGVLCVHSSHQQKGIGQALVKKCEQVAVDVWDDRSMFVDVEPDNVNALSFFEKCGYDRSLDESGGVQMRGATVARRGTSESRPHYLLRKTLPMNTDKGI